MPASARYLTATCVDCGKAICDVSTRCGSCARLERYRRERVAACRTLVPRVRDLIDRLHLLMRPRSPVVGLSIPRIDSVSVVAGDLARLERELGIMAETIMLDELGAEPEIA